MNPSALTKLRLLLMGGTLLLLLFAGATSAHAQTDIPFPGPGESPIPIGDVIDGLPVGGGVGDWVSHVPGLGSIIGFIKSAIELQFLKKIYDEYIRQGGNNSGFISLVRKMSDVYKRVVTSATFTKIKDVLSQISDIRQEAAKLSCNWTFSVHDPLAPFRNLFNQRMYFCKPELVRRYGTGTVTLRAGLGGATLDLPGHDDGELINFLGATHYNQMSARTDAQSSSWTGLLQRAFNLTARTRTSPGEAERDGAVRSAQLQHLMAVNAQTISRDALFRQLDHSLEQREERDGIAVAQWMYGMKEKTFNVPVYQSTPAPPDSVVVPLPGDIPPTDGSGGSGSGGAGDDNSSCNRTFGQNVAFGEVLAAIDLTAQRHPEWQTSTGSDGREHPGPQTYFAPEFWDAYYGDVVANLNRAGLVARVDPCMCGEIQVKHRGDDSVSDQYHILTSWGQIRNDQNAYRDTCYPAVF